MARETISSGSSGDSVVELQQILSGLGYEPGPIDGAFGPQTDAAVRRFQQARGLAEDGVVGDATWASVDANVAEANAAGAAAGQAEADAKAAAERTAAAAAKQATADAEAAAAKAAAEEAAIQANAANMSSIMAAAKEAMGGDTTDTTLPL